MEVDFSDLKKTIEKLGKEKMKNSRNDKFHAFHNRKASSKQLTWIQYWLHECGKTLQDYGYMRLEDLTMSEAGIVIGLARKEIEKMGFQNTESYIKHIKEAKLNMTTPQNNDGNYSLLITNLTNEELNIVKTLESNSSTGEVLAFLNYIYKNKKQVI
jgi:hypothetical protein